uniref:Uncharacterized protein n=1 Tax=Leersia perrieri TaxID=77586 RepID=A0A0D9X6Z1_9ORYZ
METVDETNSKRTSEPSVEMDVNGKLPWSEAERRCDIWWHRHRHSLASGRDRHPTIIAPYYVSTKLGSAYGPAWRTANGGRRSRGLRPSSRLRAVAREACRAYQRRGEAGVNSSASLQATAINCVCGWSRRTVESVFRMADRQGKISGLIQHTIDKGENVIRRRRGVVVYKQQWRRMRVPILGFVTIYFMKIAIWRVVNINDCISQIYDNFWVESCITECALLFRMTLSW